jgi:maltose O-acetyltransferase
LRFDGITFGKHVFIDSGVRFSISAGGSVVIKDDVYIGRNTLIVAKKGSIEIGQNAHLSHGLTLVCISEVSIGNDCLVGEYVTIRDQNHGMSAETSFRLQEAKSKPIRISRNVWIGAHSSVLMGADIEEGCIVGANSVVRSKLISSSLYAGVPVKRIRSLDSRESDSQGLLHG